MEQKPPSPSLESRLRMKPSTTVDMVKSILSHSEISPYKNLSTSPGDTVKILCTASQDIGNDMELYQLKRGQTPKLLIHDSRVLFSGVPTRFSGSLNGAETTFTITRVQTEDEAEYHCAQSEEYPLTQ
ncbi:hypothetical protein AAFF_G00163410 [Aldrovandia affinis]|uniref:Ig-like domain-containing protein n=1 Tax=Aldrovandia affinis TaxID=143900 RepID=A0AAD7SZF3_9TELE|nr:hypothetical protein AAFF_G00163410 [Aldrovandia affinis]